MKEAVAICCGGGPAPGINTVIGSVSKIFLRNGWRVIGLHGGYSGLFEKDPKKLELDFLMADNIFNRGGSFLKMSRFKPSDEDFEENFNLELFTENNIKLLVTVGGDDTASTANRIARFLEKKGYPVKNIHVPKTIDNDLPLPAGTPTFGYHSAEEAGVSICNTVYEDARTSGTWFIVSAMGRSAGHLAAGIGAACHYPMIIIPEMFNKTEITVDKIVNLVVSSIVKRKLLGVDYGAAIVSEGVFHVLSEEEIENSGIVFSHDDHGHPELGKVSKAHIFNEMVENKLEKLGIKVKSRPCEVGYEIRCVRPTSYDLVYCSMLGMGVYQLYYEGHSGCMVYVDQIGNVKPLYLNDLQQADGTIPPRLVDIESTKAQMLLRNNLQFISPEDYNGAKKYVEDPESLDFVKILNWEY
jgi:6-phosphofructokinase 1